MAKKSDSKTKTDTDQSKTPGKRAEIQWASPDDPIYKMGWIVGLTQGGRKAPTAEPNDDEETE